MALCDIPPFLVRLPLTKEVARRSRDGGRDRTKFKTVAPSVAVRRQLPQGGASGLYAPKLISPGKTLLTPHFYLLTQLLTLHSALSSVPTPSTGVRRSPSPFSDKPKRGRLYSLISPPKHSSLLPPNSTLNSAMRHPAAVEKTGKKEKEPREKVAAASKHIKSPNKFTQTTNN